ncbi:MULTISPECIES: CitMHS family transporter [Cytobacillus]|uniref:CitMHS family transporter n=1 Tax=Cytobacillus TaxID=2675230 RepID=UPI001CD4B3C9|nr:citrate:proton symporter [Cytobacillus kochii]MCA1026233.1 citrate:proton symporter [Cytobacillus kochii]MCM3322606.1 citrate:proton symporter [Cytobacillus kochii]MCM3344915.1 citrate:proton symporter [Cytobacillus kochii]MDM5209466.1 citrate:proton symporter [Cytobacillus kochii]
MLSIMGFLTIAIFLYLILSKKVSVIVALILVPVFFGLFTTDLNSLGAMILEGVTSVAPTGIMLAFAILFFGLMSKAGLFDPIISRILKLVKGDPLKIVIGTAIIGMVTHLDGSGASTFLITIPALLPLYERLGMSRLVLAGVVALSAGTMNIVPWGGPTARASSALGIDTATLFNPLIPAMIAGLIWVLFVSYYFGKKERNRIGIQNFQYDFNQELSEEEKKARRPKLLWLNFLLTILTIVALVKVWLPLPVIFMVAFALALILNYPNPKDQQERITEQATGMVTVVSIIFAAGIFTGVLSGTGMIEAMANTLVSIIPESTGSFMGLIVAITSMPLSLVFTPDAYYFGILPVLSETAANYGVAAENIGRAAILGQMTTGFPLSPLTAATFLLLGLARVELADHQRFIFIWAFGTTIVMTIVALITGAIAI